MVGLVMAKLVLPHALGKAAAINCSLPLGLVTPEICNHTKEKCRKEKKVKQLAHKLQLTLPSKTVGQSEKKSRLKNSTPVKYCNILLIDNKLKELN